MNPRRIIIGAGLNGAGKTTFARGFLSKDQDPAQDQGRLHRQPVVPGQVNLDAIFADPIYARRIGSFEDIDRQFDGRLRRIVGAMQGSFRRAA